MLKLFKILHYGKILYFQRGAIVSPGFNSVSEAEDWGATNNYHGILIQMIKTI